MARLTLTLAALFAALLFVAHATASRTTITTVDIDEDIDQNPRRQGGSCREQMQSQQYLNHCERYMRQQCMSGSYDIEDNQQQHFQQCCQQLRHMDEQCRCEGLRQVVRRHQGQLQTDQEMREMMQCARNLPNECGIGPGRCEMRGGWF